MDLKTPRAAHPDPTPLLIESIPPRDGGWKGILEISGRFLSYTGLLLTWELKAF